MDRNNIIPIARDAQETTASQRRHFRVLVAVLVIAWAAVLAAAVVLTPLPPLVPFAFLAVLVILAEHRFVLFGDETSMSGSMIVIVASVFVFADTSPLAGPVLIASLGGIYFPHLRARAWNRLFFNVSSFGLSAGAAVAVSRLGWADGPTSQYKLGIAVAAACAYWITNNFIVAGHQKYLHERPFVSSALSLITSDLGVFYLAATTAFVVLIDTASGFDACFLITLCLLASAILERCWQSASGFLERVDRHWGPLTIWAAIIAAALIADSLTPAVVALALITTLMTQRIGPRHDRGRSNVLLAAAVIVAFTGWAIAVLVVLAWGGAVRQQLPKWTPWASALLWGVLGTSLTFAALDLTNILPTGGSTVAATVGPWVVGSLICISTVIASRRHINWITAAGLAVPTRGEVLLAAIVIAESILLTGSIPTAVGIGTFVIIVRTCRQFRLRGTAVTASR